MPVLCRGKELGMLNIRINERGKQKWKVEGPVGVKRAGGILPPAALTVKVTGCCRVVSSKGGDCLSQAKYN